MVQRVSPHPGHGGASHSLHMRAMAIDIWISGVNTAELRDITLSLYLGGVGYYLQSEICACG